MHRYIQLYATKQKKTFQSVDIGIAASQTRLLQHNDARPFVNDSVNCSGGCELTCHRLGPRSGCPVQVVSPENLHSDARWHLPGVVCRRNRNVPLFWTLNSGNPAHQKCAICTMWGVSLSFDTKTMQRLSRRLPMFVSRLKCGRSDASCFCAAEFHSVNQDTDRCCVGNIEGGVFPCFLFIFFLLLNLNFRKYDGKEAT